MANTFEFNGKGFNLVGESRGEGPVLLFLHAGVADRRMWQHQVSHFEKSWHCISYDRRGYGDSHCDDVSFSHLDDLVQILDLLDIQELSIVCCSMGGALALSFTMAYPERVSRLVLVAAAIPGEAHTYELPPAIAAKIQAIDDAEASGDISLLNQLEADIWLDGPTSPSGRVGVIERDLFLDMNGIALRKPELHLEVKCIDIYHQLGAIKVPSLVICGELDFPRVQENGKRLASELGDAKLLTYDDVAHLLNLEIPERFNQDVECFLNRIE